MDRKAIERALSKAAALAQEYLDKRWANDAWLFVDGRTFWKEIDTALATEGVVVPKELAQRCDDVLKWAQFNAKACGIESPDDGARQAWEAHHNALNDLRAALRGEPHAE